MEYTSPISEQNSSLRLYNLDPTWAQKIADCAAEIDSTLIHRPQITVYGKICHQNRSIGFYSNSSIGYRYSGQIASSQPLTPLLQELLDFINTKFSANFNGILINKYEGGNDYIGAHSDDENGLNPNVGVVCLSYGAVRKFRIRRKSNKEIVCDVPTNPTQIIHMQGDFQKHFTHEIPIERRVRETRYSFTFRHHNE